MLNAPSGGAGIKAKAGKEDNGMIKRKKKGGDGKGSNLFKRDRFTSNPERRESMRVIKILLISFIFLIGATLLTGGSSEVWAKEEQILVAADVSRQTPGVRIDCKAVETKDKDGKMVIRLEGKGCQKIVNELGSSKDKVCCICRKQAPGHLWVCEGTCCKPIVERFVNITPQ